MPRKCKHEVVFARRWVSGEWIVLLGDSKGADARRCSACHAWLSLGPSDETDERVAVELAAASLAQSWADNDHKPGYDRFDWCPDKRDELCSLCEQRYLARCIVEHEDGES